MVKEKTTELDKLKHGATFTWGEVIQIYEIGEYSIIESHPHIFVNHCGTDEIDYSQKEFHTYIGSKDCGHSYTSLDAALVGCIAYKYEGTNSRAGVYFMKMIAGEEK